MSKYILFLFIISSLISCDRLTDPNKETPKEEETPLNEVTPSSEFFPLSVGNYWQYEESYSSPDTNFTDYFISTITEIKEEENCNWFKIESKKDHPTPETMYNNLIGIRFLTMENDSVYELQHNWEWPIAALEYFIPKEKKESFNTFLGGDVIIRKTAEILDTTMHTKIGNFTNCFRYTYSSPDWTEIEILVYGIGIVEKQFITYSFTNGNETSRRIEKIVAAKINSEP